MKNKNLLLFRIITGLFSAMMLFSASMYFFNYDMVAATFTNLGFPTYIIYPLAIAKILGVIAIWSNKSAWLKEWAYAGFVFNTLLAASAHIGIEDGEFYAAVAGLTMVSISYFLDKKLAR